MASSKCYPHTALLIGTLFLAIILFVAADDGGLAPAAATTTPVELEGRKEATLGLIERLGENEKALIDQISGMIGGGDSSSSSSVVPNGLYWDLFVILSKCVGGLDGSYKDLKLALDAFKKGNYLTAKLLVNDAFLTHLTCKNNIAMGAWPIVKGALFPGLKNNQQLFEETIQSLDSLVPS